MPDIDSLSINLTASANQATTAINTIIKSLGELNGALSNYSADSQYVKGLNNIVGGFKDLSSTINSIDIQKIKDLSSVLGSLARNGEKLTKLNYVQSFGELGSGIQRINAQASHTAKDVMEMFDIPKRNKNVFNDAFRQLYNSKNEDIFSKTSEHIRQMVRDSQRAKADLSETYKYVRRYLSGVKLYLSPEIMSEWGDSAKSNRGILGIGNTTTNLQDANIHMEELVAELNRVYGASIDTEHGITGMANSLVDFLSEEKYVERVHADLSGLADIFDLIRTKIFGVSDAFTALNTAAANADEEMLTLDASGNIVSISSQTGEVINQMNNLAASTEVVKEELGSIAVGNPFEGLIVGLESLQGFEFPSDKFVGISTLASAFTKFGKADAEKALTVIPQIGQAFSQMASQLAEAPAISDNVVRLAEALSTFSRSGNAATASTVNMSNMFGKTLMNSLKAIPLMFNKITAAIKKTANGIVLLINKASRLGSTFSKLITSSNSLLNSNRRLHLSFTSLAAIFGTWYANFFLLYRLMRLLGKAIEYSSSMTEAQNVVAVAFGKQASVMDDFAQTAIKDFGIARLSAVQFGARFQSMGKNMGITAKQIGAANDFIRDKIAGNTRAYADLGDSVADMSVNLTKLTADMASLYNQDYNDVADDMAAIYTGMTRPLRKYGLDLTQATLKEWALANGLDADIEKMTQAEKTMLRYQYVMTKASNAMGDFVKTADTWANAMRTVKQYMQELARVIGEMLINTFRPALLAFRNFIQNFLGLAQSALNAVGKLLGWTKVDFGGAALVEDMEDYADAIDDATGAAKKLKGQLRGIDELNNLTTNDKGGGGGSGADLLGIDDLDKWEEIIDKKEKYESKIKDWYDLGLAISRKLAEGMLSIDWNKIYKKYSDFGKNLASLLNGIVQPGTFRLAGKTYIDSLNAVAKAIGSFLGEFNFKKAGVSVANFFNGMFGDWNPSEWVEYIRLGLHGILDAFDGFFNGMEGEVFGSRIEGLNMDVIHRKIKEFVVGIAASIRDTLNEIKWDEVFDVFKDLGKNLADTLNSVITPQNFAAIGKTLINVLNSIFIGLNSFGKELNFSDAISTIGKSLAAGINNFFDNWKPEEWAEALNNFVNGFFQTLAELFGKDDGLDLGMIVGKIATFFKNLDWKVWVAAIAGIITQVSVALVPIISGVLATLFKAFSPLLKLLWKSTLWPALQVFWTGTVYPELEGALIGLATKGGLIKIITSMLTTLGKGIITGLKTVFTKIIPSATKYLASVIIAILGGISIGSGLGEIVSRLFGKDDLADAYEKFNPAQFITNKLFGAESTDDLMDKYLSGEHDLSKKLLPGEFTEGFAALVKPVDDLRNSFEFLKETFIEWTTEIDWTTLTEKTSTFLLNLVAIGGPGTSDGVLSLSDAFLNLADNEGKASSIVETLKDKFTSFKDDTATILKNWWDNDIAPKFDLSTWTELVSSIKESIKTVWEDTVKFWSDEVPIWWDEHVAVWFERGKWDELVRTIKDSITTVWTNMVTWWNENIQSWWDNNVVPWFTEETWLGALDGILRAFESVWGDAREFARGFFNNVAQFAEDFINGVIDGFKALAGAKSIFSDSPIEFNVGHISLPRFANGGFPQVGSLFIAGEAGSEMVGSINGRTGVASNGEITGIADAIRSTSGTEIELLREQNVLLQGILEKEFGISGDSLFKSVRTSAREYTRRTGNPAW